MAMGPLRVLSNHLAMVVAALLAAGCASHPVQTFTGPPRPASEIALVSCQPGLAVVAVDDDRSVHGVSSEARPLVLELLPGRHTVTVRFHSVSGTDQVLMSTFTTTESESIDLEIHAQAGHAYRLVFSTYGDRWRPSLRDVTPD